MADTRVYFNGACPVCAAGIRYQRRKLGGGGPGVDWIDVDARHAAADEIGADLEFVRERLHVVDRAGTTHVGFDAFLALWHVTPGQTWLARVGAVPLVRPILRRAYNGFAAVLYRWNRRHGRW